jgi:squalene-hopene/tetraprenyl-beta-curcumene cyclase
MSHPDFQAESADRAASSRANRTYRPDRGGDSADLYVALRTGLECLLKEQKAEGFWVGELEADASLEADAILLDYYLGNPDLNRVQKLAGTIREEQGAEGGWSLYPGGAPNVNVTVKAWFGLRLAGVAENDPALRRARDLALQLGGVEATNSFTRICLCFLDQYDWKAAPALPPELLLLPNFAYVNIYEVSSWSRAMLVPLSIIYAFQPHRKPPAGVTLRPLFLPGSAKRGNLLLPGAPLYSWKTLIHAADRTLSVLEQKKWTPLRRKALRRAEQWLLDHLKGSDGLGAIFPAMMNSIVALDCLGYDHEGPLFRRELAEFWRLGIEEPETMRMQPCFSPIWDTALAILVASGALSGPPGAAHTALEHGAEWLISKQILVSGDWAVKNPDVESGGWCFEFANDPYPDVDDTAMALLALSRVRIADSVRQRTAIRRGLNWVLSMQNADGGWASFDKDNNKTLLCQVPYADHNAMLDPSCPDITGRVLETLGTLGYDAQFLPALRAIQFLRQQQESDGCWYGRWGVNYIYGTCFALRGLASIGIDMREGFCLRAAEWIRSFQNADGGWGESCDSYDNPDLRGVGPSTAAQTAWALLGLFATEDFDSGSVERGIRYLLETQRNGTWEDSPFTGTGFPRVFYLKYHLYSLYFPILALSEYARHKASGPSPYRGLADWSFSPQRAKR